jgi:hypothetical protein
MRRRLSLSNRVLPLRRDPAEACARLLAEKARYPLFPLFLLTSRNIVTRCLPNSLDISDIDFPDAKDRLISSRSLLVIRKYFVVCIRMILSPHPLH